jgi:oligopeptidase A
MPVLSDDRSLCSFGHIFTGGYAAAYYSYKWSEVMSADAFGAFEEAGLDNEVQVKAIGRRYTDTILALGGSVAPARVYEEFRGRGPSTAALLRHSGLAAA